MSDKLNDFLIEVAADADKADAFRRDPKSFLQTTRLTGEERVAVMTGDSHRIRAKADAMDPPVAMIGPSAERKSGGKKKGGKKKGGAKKKGGTAKNRGGAGPVATKQPRKTKRAPAARKTSRKSSKKK